MYLSTKLNKFHNNLTERTHSVVSFWVKGFDCFDKIIQFEKSLKQYLHHSHELKTATNFLFSGNCDCFPFPEKDYSQGLWRESLSSFHAREKPNFTCWDTLLLPN